MKNPNGYGGVVKLSGNRRKPFMAYKTITVSDGNFIPPAVKNRLQAIREALNDASDEDTIREIAETASEFVPMREICESLIDLCLSKDFVAKKKKKAIGYYKTAKEAHIALAEANRDNLDLSDGHTFEEVYKMAFDDKGIDRKSDDTVRSYNLGFKYCKKLHKEEVKNITVQMLQSVIDEKAGASVSTQTIIIKVMKLVMKYATARDMCAKDVSAFVHLAETGEKKEKHPFTLDEINILKENGYDDIVYLIFTGMRVSEYLSLKDKDFEDGIIHVRGTKNKTSDRFIPKHPILAELHPKWNRYQYGAFRLRFVEAMDKLGMNHTIHETRHTFATLCKKYHMDDTMRKYIMGHITGSITDDVYTHPELLIPELVKEVRKISA